jgi:hypothetical protein
MSVLKAKKRGRPYLYPWGKWLNGKKHKLILSKDIHCTVHTFRVNFVKKAKQVNRRTRTQTITQEDGSVVLIIQAVPLS